MFVLVGLILMLSCSSPEAKFIAQFADGEDTPEVIAFTNNSVNCEAYTWSFGDGQTSSEENPTHSFERFGNLMVVLEGKKGSSVDRDTQYINIPEPPRKKVKIETELGDMVLELYNSTPLHRDNFIKLVKEGFYDGLLFHRIIKGFMIQGGDPDSRNAPAGQQLGMGGTGYTIPAEIAEPHYKGALAAARKGDQINPGKESSGSQFYIVHGKTYSPIELGNLGGQSGIVFSEEQVANYGIKGGAPFLDTQYSVFGQILEGVDVIDKIAVVETNSDRPLEDITMKVTIIE